MIRSEVRQRCNLLVQELTLVLVGPDMQACSHLALPLQRPATQHCTLRDVPVALCKRCQQRKRSLQLVISAQRYEAAFAQLPAPHIIMMFHPGLAAQQRQFVETHSIWQPSTLTQQQQHGNTHSKSITVGSKGVCATTGRCHDAGKGRPAADSRPTAMRCLRSAWKPALRHIGSGACPVFCTAFSFAGAPSECLACFSWQTTGGHDGTMSQLWIFLCSCSSKAVRRQMCRGRCDTAYILICEVQKRVMRSKRWRKLAYR